VRGPIAGPRPDVEAADPFALPQVGSGRACDTARHRQVKESAGASRHALATLRTSSRNPRSWPMSTEAVRRLLHYLLIERGKHRVRATCDDRNTRSAAVLERVGMRREGHLLESTWSKGEWTNDLLYAVLRREWPSGS
jgi:hypothetical protein